MDEATHERAAGQHSALETALREAGYDVHLHTIALGIAGTVDVGLPGTLAELGVPLRSVKMLLGRLNKHAAQSVAWIWGARLQRISNSGKHQPSSKPAQGKGVT